MKGHACWPSHYPNSLFIFILSLSKGLFGQGEEDAQKAISCIVIRDCRNNSTEQPLNAGFNVRVSRVNMVSIVS